jgi:DnaA family protein
VSAPQLPLALAPPRRPRFSNFIAGENGLVVRTLRDGLEPGQWVRVSGPEGSGRSHLALATVACLAERNLRCVFVPGSAPAATALLDSAGGDWVVIDDYDALAGDDEKERALFNALNRWRADRTGVVLTGGDRSAFHLPDLRSRLGQAAHLVLKPLDDRALEAVVRQLIEDYGVVAGRGLVDYLLRHAPRGVAPLAGLVERMSQQALAERRVLSIPMARACLEAVRNG